MNCTMPTRIPWPSARAAMPKPDELLPLPLPVRIRIRPLSCVACAIFSSTTAFLRCMQRKKAVVDEKIAQATQDKGLILILTGNGKGKSSSGFGMAARALGHGMRVGIVQFIKGSYSTGEEAFFRRFPEVEYHVMGAGFTWETQDRERD